MLSYTLSSLMEPRRYIHSVNDEPRSSGTPPTRTRRKHIYLWVGQETHVIGENVSRREPSLKEYSYLLQTEKLLHYSGFMGGWLAFLYYWVFKLWDADIAVLPAVVIGLLVYAVGFLVYDIYSRPRRQEYEDAIDLIYPPYWDLVESVMEGKREKAQKAIEELRAYVPDPAE